MSEEFTTRVLTPEEYAIWDALVDTAPSGTPFQTTWWMGTLAQELGAHFQVIGCFRKGMLWGGCALFGRRTGPYCRAIFPPTALYNGIVVRPRDTDSYPTQVMHTIAVTESLGRWIRQHVHEAHLTHHYTLLDVRGLIWQGWRSQARYTYVLPLDTREKMLQRSDRTRGVMVRQAEQAGLRCEPSENIEAFLPLYARTFARHGMEPPVPLQAIAATYRAGRSRQAAQLFLTRTPAGEIVSGTIALWTQRNAMLWLAASAPDWLEKGAAALTYLETFSYLASRFQEVDYASANVHSLHYNAALLGGELRLVPRTELIRSPALRFLHVLKHLGRFAPEEG